MSQKDLNLRQHYYLVTDYHQRKANMLDQCFRSRFLKLKKMMINYELNGICFPKNSELVQKIFNEAHNGTMSVHPGSNKMYHDLKKMYWWLGMKRDISEFVSKCLICQQVKAGHQVPSGLLQPVTIPEWKWERSTMDFVSGPPLSLKKKNSIWVIIDRLIKSAHFIPVRMYFSLDRLAKLYGVPVSIILDRDPYLHPDSGISCKKLWVHGYISVLHFILRLMVNPNV
ncbi:integrase [Gossypium australe]|uniref:Integrase n=1 Tax=Gossypium australe TaxID=47621 RepID=A0A5B6X2P7_9ROSI|nr:integrase [Gossypium australe]